MTDLRAFRCRIAVDNINNIPHRLSIILGDEAVDILVHLESYDREQGGGEDAPPPTTSPTPTSASAEQPVRLASASGGEGREGRVGSSSVSSGGEAGGLGGVGEVMDLDRRSEDTVGGDRAIGVVVRVAPTAVAGRPRGGGPLKRRRPNLTVGDPALTGTRTTPASGGGPANLVEIRPVAPR